jgi:hypothetical protein
LLFQLREAIADLAAIEIETAAGLPQEQRTRAILFGMTGATILLGGLALALALAIFPVTTAPRAATDSTRFPR